MTKEMKTISTMSRRELEILAFAYTKDISEKNKLDHGVVIYI